MREVTFDLYAWKSPCELEADQAADLLEQWHEAGGDPSTSPFEPSTDVGWFYRELKNDHPEVDTSSDAVPNVSTRSILLSTEDEPPARMVAMRLSPDTSRDVLASILGLAAKYDLVLFNARSRTLHRPLEEMAAHASATFWPAGAIQAGVAGGIGGLLAVGAWHLAIPILSGLVMLVGGFMFVMAVFTFVHEGRNALRAAPH